MPSRGSYVLKIAGVLRDGPGANASAIGEFRQIFPDAPPPAGSGDGWPAGFMLKDFRACQWSPSAEPFAPKQDETLLTFRAEVSIQVPGQLYDNRGPFLDHVRWFYHYRDQKWHSELSALLRSFHQRQQAKVLDRVWFRDWQWYCGNGGDGS
jgi:hypothetical protein